MFWVLPSESWILPLSIRNSAEGIKRASAWNELSFTTFSHARAVLQNGDDAEIHPLLNYKYLNINIKYFTPRLGNTIFP
jgi:hypothetical protein